MYVLNQELDGEASDLLVNICLACFFVFLVNMFFNHAYPVLLRDCVNPEWFWRVLPITQYSNSNLNSNSRQNQKQNIIPQKFSYRPFLKSNNLNFECARKTFHYSGQVDENGRPNGFGEWIDTDGLGKVVRVIRATRVTRG